MIYATDAIAVEWYRGDTTLIWRDPRLPLEAIPEIADQKTTVADFHVNYGEWRWFCCSAIDTIDPNLYLVGAKDQLTAEESFMYEYGERLDLFKEPRSYEESRDLDRIGDKYYDASSINISDLWRVRRIWCDKRLLMA